jgi:hypothetical protein
MAGWLDGYGTIEPSNSRVINKKSLFFDSALFLGKN